jgi:hypothetical protein
MAKCCGVNQGMEETRAKKGEIGRLILAKVKTVTDLTESSRSIFLTAYIPIYS